MQNTTLMTNDPTSLISTQINSLALQRSQEREAEATRDAALNERIASLEERLQSILQENLRIEAELNQARDLYQQKKEAIELNKKTLLDEIAPLNSEVQRLTESINAISQTNLALANQVAPTIALRNFWYSNWYQEGLNIGIW